LSGEYDVNRYFDLSRKFCTTAKLVGNLHALRAWYQNVRQTCAESDSRLLYAAAAQEFDRHIKHRARELAKLVGKLDKSLSKPSKHERDRRLEEQHRRLLVNRERINSFLLHEDCADAPAILLAEYTENRRTREHVESVRDLSAEASAAAIQWIREVASQPYLQIRALFNSSGKPFRDL